MSLSSSSLVLLLLLMGPQRLWCNAAMNSKPNVVFILVDDVGYNDIGYNNRSQHSSGRILTPNIDRLADSGVKLDNYYVQPICSPTRGALMTGRYSFRYCLGGNVIASTAPWAVPNNETFLPQYLKEAGYKTAQYGKWHLGFFKNDSLPMARGFDEQSGFYTGAVDHYTHLRVEDSPQGYDWHVNQTFSKECIGKYSGNLVRDNAVDYIQRQAKLGEDAPPFFLYLPFQEAHSPYQVDQKYKDMYPHLASKPETQALAGMITHTDDMVEDIVQALKSTGLYENTIIIFSSDNGGIGGQDHLTQAAKPFDDSYIDCNYPFRGQKREIYEGGVRVAGFVHSPLLPDKVRGTTLHEIVHVTDWVPTIVAATGKVARWQNLIELGSNLDCAPMPSTLAQSKERKGSNFSAQCSGAIVLGCDSID